MFDRSKIRDVELGCFGPLELKPWYTSQVHKNIHCTGLHPRVNIEIRNRLFICRFYSRHKKCTGKTKITFFVIIFLVIFILSTFSPYFLKNVFDIFWWIFRCCIKIKKLYINIIRNFRKLEDLMDTRELFIHKNFTTEKYTAYAIFICKS